MSPVLMIMTLILTSCGAPPIENRGVPSDSRSTTKTLVLGVTSTVQGFSIGGASSTTGGWETSGEIHSNGLITADVDSRNPIGQLAESAPSFDDGSITPLLDGRVRVVYRLRRGVTWQDGTPFTAQDLIFSRQLNGDPSLPSITAAKEAARQMDSVEAPDEHTFWTNIVGDVCSIAPMPPERFHRDRYFDPVVGAYGKSYSGG